jgi:hypothetical protein
VNRPLARTAQRSTLPDGQPMKGREAALFSQWPFAEAAVSHSDIEPVIV